MTPRKHAALAVTCFLLALSPIGAPAVGVLISTVCPVDSTVGPDGPFALPFHYCGLSRPVEHLYQKAIFSPLMAVAVAGQLVGGAIALAWVLLACALPFAFLWNTFRAMAARRYEPDDAHA